MFFALRGSLDPIKLPTLTVAAVEIARGNYKRKNAQISEI